MAVPPIFISYGMTKSGSTLAFELQKAILEANGFSQDVIGGGLSQADNKNYVWDKDKFPEIYEALKGKREYVAIKTHAPPSDAMRKRIASGQVLAHAVYRDPREIALSVIDHGRDLRARQVQGQFANIKTIRDAIPWVQGQCRNFLKWKEIPNVLTICYNEVAFDQKTCVQRMAKHVGLRVDAAAIVAKVARDGRTLFNKGKYKRYETEMDQETQDLILKQTEWFMREVPELAQVP